MCAEVGGDDWYPEKGDAGEQAKAVCRGCEARVSCLEAALSRPGEQGIWGGFSERARIRVARQHAAGKSLEGVIAADDDRHYARMEAREAIGATPEERHLAAQRRRRQAKREAVADPTPQLREVAA